jgi:hypothetical protein
MLSMLSPAASALPTLFRRWHSHHICSYSLGPLSGVIDRLYELAGQLRNVSSSTSRWLLLRCAISRSQAS